MKYKKNIKWTPFFWQSIERQSKQFGISRSIWALENEHIWKLFWCAAHTSQYCSYVLMAVHLLMRKWCVGSFQIWGNFRDVNNIVTLGNTYELWNNETHCHLFKYDIFLKNTKYTYVYLRFFTQLTLNEHTSISS